MATKKDILNKLDVIERKLPNGEVKEMSQTMNDFKELQDIHHSKMDKHFSNITKINEALKNLD